MLIYAVFTFSQRIEVVKNEKLTIASAYGFYPVMNAEGTLLLYTSGNYEGLYLQEIGSGKNICISEDPGAGFEPVFSESGDQVYYRKERREDGKRFKSVMRFDRTTAHRELAVAESRDNVALRKKMNRLQNRTTKTEAVSENLELVVYRNGIRKVLTPFDKVPGYIWVSLSPAQDRILFTAPSKGTFVCDLNGKVIASLGELNAPVWYDDNWIVGMEDHDNGEDIVKSGIVMISADGKNRTVLTPDSLIAMYPTASAKSKKIAYNTANGEMYMMEIDIR